MKIEAETIVRSDLRGNLFPVILALLFWLPCLYLLVSMPDMENIKVFFMASMAVSLVIYWLISFRISFFAETVEYKPPFGRAKTAEYCNIARISHKIFSRSESAKYNAVFVLLVQTKDKYTIGINIKPFSLDALHHISAILAQKCDEAHFDNSVKKWTEKDFNSLSLTWSQRGSLLLYLFLVLSGLAIIQALIRMHH